ncbi:MAG: hypothetical protein JW932_03865 [Deltaproteobacteria bacterium]|nr:hypothetical protein [Deltaproteobacteria bacterium]
MKIKTSITISEEIIQQIDALAGQFGNRSNLIEKAIREFLVAESSRRRDLKDMDILNRRAEKMNKEGVDVLSYQADV